MFHYDTGQLTFPVKWIKIQSLCDAIFFIPPSFAQASPPEADWLGNAVEIKNHLASEVVLSSSGAGEIRTRVQTWNN